MALLPVGDETVFFANVTALRQAGYLRLLADAKAQQEKDYAAFVRETGFDYTNDLEALTGAADGQQLFFVLRGRFDWSRMRRYIAGHGGNCEDSLCKIPASTPGRWISLLQIQPDVVAVAVSTDNSAAEALRRSPGAGPEMASGAPVWVRPSHALLTNPADIPLAMRIFAISLESANSVVLSLASSNAIGAAFAVELAATFVNQPAAETARKQLEINTNMLKLELAHEHKEANAADLSGLLTSGTFEVRQQTMAGTWIVRKELLASLQ